MNIRRLLKRLSIISAIFIVGLSLIFGGLVMALWGRDAYFSPIPRLGNYETQKEWAHQVHDKVARASEILAPRFYWNWPLRAYQDLLKRYPERAIQDENIWAGMGTCYMFLGEFNEAVESYQHQLNLFKTQYYGKDYPQKREIGVLKTELEEIKWITNIHNNIANSYLAMKQPVKAIEEYNAVIKEFDPKLQKYSEWEQYKVIGDHYEKIASIYANELHDYPKAIELYESVYRIFSKEPLVRSRSKTAIADCYIAMGDLEKGKTLYRAIIEEYPDPKMGYAWTAKKHLKRVESGDLARWRVGS